MFQSQLQPRRPPLGSDRVQYSLLLLELFPSSTSKVLAPLARQLPFYLLSGMIPNVILPASQSLARARGHLHPKIHVEFEGEGDVEKDGRRRRTRGTRRVHSAPALLPKPLSLPLCSSFLRSGVWTVSLPSDISQWEKKRIRRTSSG